MMIEIESLRRDLAALSARIDALETGAPAPAAAVKDAGLEILSGAELRQAGFNGVSWPGSEFVQPDPASLEQLYAITIAAYPHLGPKHGTSLETVNSEHFRDFTTAFRFLGSVYRTPKIDHRRGALTWCGEFEGWPGRNEIGGSFSVHTLLLAAVAHGDIEGLVPDHVPGSSFALSLNSGSPAREGWREVLKRGRPTGLTRRGEYNRLGQLEAVNSAAA